MPEKVIKSSLLHMLSRRREVCMPKHRILRSFMAVLLALLALFGALLAWMYNALPDTFYVTGESSQLQDRKSVV